MDEKLTPNQKKIEQELKRNFRHELSSSFYEKMENAPWMIEPQERRFRFKILSLDAMAAAVLIAVMLAAVFVLPSGLNRFREQTASEVSRVIETVGEILRIETDSVNEWNMITVKSRPDDWSRDIFSPTNIEVTKGDTISFLASGEWSVGTGNVSADGFAGTACECTVRERVNGAFVGSLGGLIGRIGKDGEPFLIGSKNSITATDSGVLYLTSNDNLGPCNGSNRQSCYEDNRGSLDVWVEVK